MFLIENCSSYMLLYFLFLVCDDPNAAYNECASYCPETCHPDEDLNCPDVCVPGCTCLSGFVLHNGVCVDVCPPK